jgi:predicted DNA-binding transcriptional regulator AlpA
MRPLVDAVMNHRSEAPAALADPELPTEFPDLVATLARRLAEAWLRTFTSLAVVPPSLTPLDQDGDYTAKELGKQLQMSESTIYKHWRAGAWPSAYMISKRKGLRIPRRDVEAWKAAKLPGRPAWTAKPKTSPSRIVNAS